MQRSRAIAAVLAAGALVPLGHQLATATPTLEASIPVALKANSQPLGAPATASPEFAAVGPVTAMRQPAAERMIAVERAEAKRAAAKRAAAKRAEVKRKRAAAAARREAAQADVVKPTDGRLTSGFGARWGSSHNGIDLANSLGTPIVSVADGTVVEAGPASGFGLWVRIEHEDGTVTVYGHMYDFSVAEGQRVKAGQQIATIGSNGQSTGPHLHFEVWQGGGTKVDPAAWLAAKGVNL